MAGRPLPAALIILLVAIATRIVTFGNPTVILDDQFYLLVGDAMRHGAWPYIDIWDRKPIGLFLLFAGIAELGGGSILVMQIVATLFAAATALVIRRIARLFVVGEPALLAAVTYLVVLPLLGGQSAQSPVFYNLFIASAGWLLLSSAARPDAAIARNAGVAMLLCGLAMSVKPVAVVEGAAFGLCFLWLLVRRGSDFTKLAFVAIAMMAVALLPIVLPYFFYAMAGERARDAFVYANFVSIFQKEGFGFMAKLAGLGFFLLFSLPLLVLAAIGIRECWGKRRHDIRAQLLLIWLVAALLGYVAVPHFFDHYALPMVVPLSIAAAFAFARPSGRLYAAGLFLFCLIQGAVVDLGGNRARHAEFNRLSARIDEARQGGCLYLADGPTWLYQSTGACRLTPYLFPDHLNLYVERGAVGLDTGRELSRILARRPAVVVTQDSERGKHNPATQRILLGTLARDYRPFYRVPAGDGPPLATLTVWQRRDLAAPAP
jgi:4-amino-4-deoxy-L-arabinose transferase-like glycosyltransferase